MLDCICDLISTTIYLILFYFIYKIVRGVQVYILRKRKDHLKNYSADGKIPWAAITGSTSGIGQALAHQLASIGFNILLISRSVSKLQQTQKSIKQKHPGVQVEYLKANLGQDSSLKFYETICNEINQNYDIGIFINNAAVAYMDDFIALQPQQIHQMVEVNNGPYAMLLRYILPKMMQRPCRSGVINISSIAGKIYQPFNAVYAATKAFNEFLSLSIAHQVSQKIDVLCVNPAGVDTKLSRLKKNFGVIGADQCAQGILKQLGYEISTYGHWNHAIQGNVGNIMLNYLPFKLKTFVYRMLYKQFSRQRAKYD